MIRSFRYRSTNCYFLDNADGDLLAFDAGWPCTLYEYQRMMKTAGVRFDRISTVLVSHMHMDHAGLLGDFLERGIRCFVFDVQIASIDAMEKIILKNPEYASYTAINQALIARAASAPAVDAAAASIADANAFLRSVGFLCEVVATPGHSDDSVSLLTESGAALVGDLTPIFQTSQDDEVTRSSWKLLSAKGAKKAYPAHAGMFDLQGFP